MTSNKEREHIHIKVHPSRKEEWEQAVVEHEDVNTMSGLIRKAVEREISGEYDEVGNNIDLVLEGLNDMRSLLEEIRAMEQEISDEMIDTREMEGLLSDFIDGIDERGEHDGE